MEEVSHADSEGQLDDDSEQDLHSISQSKYPDPDTVVTNLWWSKAHFSSSPAVGRDVLLHNNLERSHSQSPPEANLDLSQYRLFTSDRSASQVPETRIADPNLVGRDDKASESDFALPEEDMYVLR